MNVWLQAFLLFLPAGVANTTPPIANKIPHLNRWNTPLDFGQSFHGKRILGDNKTWRGLITGTAAGALVGISLHATFFSDIAWTTYIPLCIAISLGALIGDAVESFYKRLHGIQPGSAWFPFDQIDYIIGGLIFMLPFFIPSLALTAAIFVLYLGLHVLTSYLGFLLKFKNTPI